MASSESDHQTIEPTKEPIEGSITEAMAATADKAVEVTQHAADVTEKVAEDLALSAAATISEIPAPRSTFILTLQSFCSLVFRLIAYVFLRVIPGRFGFYAIQFYLGYLAIWLLYDLRFVPRIHRDRPSLMSLVGGYSTRHRPWNILQLALHTLLLLFVLDLYYAPQLFPSHREATLRFARVGALSPTSATLHVRYPEPLPRLTGLWETGIHEPGVLTDASTLNEAPLRVVWRRAHEETPLIRAPSAVRDPRRWERGPVLRLTNETDWTASAVIQDLWPATKYEWRLAFVHNNTFTPMPARPIPFVTWPDPRLSAYRQSKFVATNETAASSSASSSLAAPLDDPNHFSFASISCVKPDFPYEPAQFWGWNWLLRWMGIGTEPGGRTLRNRIRGFDIMADHVLRGAGQAPRLRFLLELGDMIYADVPRYEGPSMESYRKLYRNVFASSSFRRIYESIPVIGMYDDHEIINNWSGEGYHKHSLVNANTSLPNATFEHNENDTPLSPPAGLHAGLRAWLEYIGHANPPAASRDENYFSFRYGDTAFFVLDTRKHRTHPDSNVENPTILGAEQHHALMSWLAEVNHTATFKFIASSVPFTSLWGGPLDLDGRYDGWSFYVDERKQLLDVLEHVPNVILLSGDRHEFAAVSFRDSVVEFSTSPLSMFYIPIRTLAQEHSMDPPGSETLLKYLPDGNHKWTEFEVDTRDPKNPAVHVRVYVDGLEAWQLRVDGRPITRPQSALGKLARSLLELLGFRKREWF